MTDAGGLSGQDWGNPMITNRNWEEMAFKTFTIASISPIPNLYFFLFYLGGVTKLLINTDS